GRDRALSSRPGGIARASASRRPAARPPARPRDTARCGCRSTGSPLPARARASPPRAPRPGARRETPRARAARAARYGGSIRRRRGPCPTACKCLRRRHFTIYNCPRMDTLDRIKGLATQELSLDPAKLDSNAPLDTLGIDSLTFIEFMFKV